MLYTALYRPMHHRLFFSVMVDGGEATWCVYSTSQPAHKNFDQFDVVIVVRVAIRRYPPTITISHTCTLCVFGCLENLPKEIKVFNKPLM